MGGFHGFEHWSDKVAIASRYSLKLRRCRSNITSIASEREIISLNLPSGIFWTGSLWTGTFSWKRQWFPNLVVLLFFASKPKNICSPASNGYAQEFKRTSHREISSSHDITDSWPPLARLVEKNETSWKEQMGLFQSVWSNIIHNFQCLLACKSCASSPGRAHGVEAHLKPRVGLRRVSFLLRELMIWCKMLLAKANSEFEL